jgi:hypothetical protein
MRLIACLAAMIFLTGCLGNNPAHEAAYQRSAERLNLVEQGKMKRSEHIKAFMGDAEKYMTGPTKAESMRALMVLYRAAKALEAGQITQDKFDEIEMEVKIRIDELEEMKRQRRIQAWSQGLQQYQNYLNSLTPRQSTQNRPPAFLKSQRTSGFNQICIYDRMGSHEAHNFKATDICPQMMQ